MTPSALILTRRLEKGREFLAGGHYETMAEVAHQVGLSPHYFSRRYRRAYPPEDDGTGTSEDTAREPA
ncbi:hypothetical protein DDZ13_03390 [Coraliomargarita sinensis]|uniref:HTH araC/xylS-type domain-containing protein n=2 Tax=Coraliomargarita sinensis TaxID=2174842 RepID=A0A317ZHS2_9BACT|nr:hypothetical protein DDZ13_03390 [Coraliomargarita sinensis]